MTFGARVCYIRYSRAYLSHTFRSGGSDAGNE